MRKIVSKKQKQKYRRLLNRITKSKNIGHIRTMILDYTSDKSNYVPTTRVGRSGLGDCNGDGNVDILDVVQLVQFILGNPETIENYGEQILSSCNVVYDTLNGTLANADTSTPTILNVVNLMHFILQITETDGSIDNTDNYELHEVMTDTEIYNHVYGYHNATDDVIGDFDYETSFVNTQYDELDNTKSPFEFGYSDFTPELVNRVLITAPHAQRVYRPTAWNTNPITGLDNDPTQGLDYCNDSGNDFPSCHKSADSCTGPMAKVLSMITGAPYLATRYKQEDPNYYHVIGMDYDGYMAYSNIGSGNSADPMEGHYNFGGIQTDTFNINSLHPFKQELSNYLNNNPQIKLVIDLHGASNDDNHWDVDLGVHGDNGNDGISGLDNLSQVDCQSMDWNLLSEIAYTFDAHGIGKCPYDCHDNLEDCDTISSFCPENEDGHGPISFNDFAARSQDSVTKYIHQNQNHSDVDAVQIEMVGIYRCLGSSSPNRVIKMMRALQEIVHKVNIYYQDN